MKKRHAPRLEPKREPCNRTVMRPAAIWTSRTVKIKVSLTRTAAVTPSKASRPGKKTSPGRNRAARAVSTVAVRLRTIRIRRSAADMASGRPSTTCTPPTTRPSRMVCSADSGAAKASHASSRLPAAASKKATGVIRRRG